MSNRKIKLDPIAEARKGKYFNKLSQEAKERIKLGLEIYNAREALKMSQQNLAKQAQSTQKVISRIESGDVNIGLALLHRIARVLEFNYENWARIFDFNSPSKIIFIGTETTSQTFTCRYETGINTISAK